MHLIKQRTLHESIQDLPWLKPHLYAQHTLEPVLTYTLAWVNPAFVDLLDYENLLEEPITGACLRYGGYQFGCYNHNLGDGRSMFYRRVNVNNEYKDVVLKGIGYTPLTQPGLNGFLRVDKAWHEFSVTQYMAKRNMPTSRVLAVYIVTHNYSYEGFDKAIVVELRSTVLRFGTREYLDKEGYLDSIEDIVSFLNWERRRQKLTLLFGQSEAEWLFKELARKVIRLAALWTVWKFHHGMLNTDNMSMAGEGFDYGHSRFLSDDVEDYSTQLDVNGFYSFKQQPDCLKQNLRALAKVFVKLPLVREEELEKIIHTYNDYYEHWLEELWSKQPV